MMGDNQAAGNLTLSDYDEVVLSKNTETIDAFSSHVIIAKSRNSSYQQVGINMMTQALHIEDGPLPQGLMVQNPYTELRKGSRNVIVVLRNCMAISSNPKEVDPSGKGNCSHMGTRALHADWYDGRVRRGSWSSST